MKFASGIQYATPERAVGSVSCGAVGNCAAVGQFRNPDGFSEAFTVTMVAGVWWHPTPVVFASGIQYATPDSDLSSVSCGSAGNCTAVGQLLNPDGFDELFTMTSTAGVWGEATGRDSTGPFVMALFAVVVGVAMMARRRRLVD